MSFLSVRNVWREAKVNKIIQELKRLSTALLGGKKGRSVAGRVSIIRVCVL